MTSDNVSGIGDQTTTSGMDGMFSGPDQRDDPASRDKEHIEDILG